MKKKSVLLAAVLCTHAIAQEIKPSGSNSDLPKDVAAQEQYILLAAKVKNLGEIQDLMLKQQQLILQNLDNIRKQVDSFSKERTNLITKTQLDNSISEVERWRKQFENEQQTNLQTVLRALQEATTRSSVAKATSTTNSLPSTKFEGYRVQAGDTLSKIVFKFNESLDKRGLPRVTQEQVERSNPGLTPDKIRIGQMLLIPVQDTKP